MGLAGWLAGWMLVGWGGLEGEKAGGRRGGELNLDLDLHRARLD